MGSRSIIYVSGEDEPDYCYRHPTRETLVYCTNCERPICTDCMITTPVGMKCPDCAKQSAKARGALPASTVGRTLAAAVVSACAVAVLDIFVLQEIAFFRIIAAYAIGVGVAEVVRWSAGGFRDPLVTRCAAGAALIGFLIPIGLDLLDGVIGGPTLAYGLVAAAAAAFAAARRAE